MNLSGNERKSLQLITPCLILPETFTPTLMILLVCNSARTDWSPIWSVIIWVICLSQVRLQTKLDNMKSYYQLIIKIVISKEKKNSQVIKESENFDLNYIFECDWLI